MPTISATRLAGFPPGGADDPELTGAPLQPTDLRLQPLLQATNLEWAAGRLKGCRELPLAAGAQLLAHGRRSRNAYLVAHGVLGVYAEPGAARAHALVGPGELVGELSVLSGGPTTMEVRAVTSARVVEIDEDTLFCLIYESHMFAINVLMMLTSRLRSSSSAIASCAERQRDLQRAVHRDALTGLRNRRWLDEELPAAIERAHFAGHPLALLVADIDHFKRVNDTHGHAEGDRVLVAVAGALAGGLRRDDLLARFGGEEFVALLPGVPIAAALGTAERLRAGVAAATVTLGDGARLDQVTVSVGVTALRPEDDAASLFARADGALYHAKQEGRNRVVFERG